MSQFVDVAILLIGVQRGSGRLHGRHDAERGEVGYGLKDEGAEMDCSSAWAAWLSRLDWKTGE
jgi:hypothetical protein